MVENMVLFLWEIDSGLIYRIPWDLEIFIKTENAIVKQEGILSKNVCHLLDGDAVGQDSIGHFFKHQVRTFHLDYYIGATMSSCIRRRNYSSWSFKFILGNLSIFSENS